MRLIILLVFKSATRLFCLIMSCINRDYEKVKAAILRENGISPEIQHQCFRQLCYHETKRPQEPEIHTKEQIMDLLVLEQFLTILPEEMQSWIWKHGPETCTEVVALAESFQLGQPEAGRPKVQNVLVHYFLLFP
uniref:SCAN box domain-containing protein n=1 Tax=Pelusios castaneus TaxID=367368 RepID=A0A8C8RJ03_9SAUR